jgi:DNA-binding MarR family transcriptional regulator
VNRMATTLDNYTLQVIDTVLAHDGFYAKGDPGEVLGNLASEAEVPYKAVSLVVLRLEEMGLVTVDRQTHPDHGRANRIVSITAV